MQCLHRFCLLFSGLFVRRQLRVTPSLVLLHCFTHLFGAMVPFLNLSYLIRWGVSNSPSPPILLATQMIFFLLERFLKNVSCKEREFALLSHYLFVFELNIIHANSVKK